MIPTDLKYTSDHEWVRVDGDEITLGITNFAQEQLTDIVFVELPTVGAQVKAGDGAVVLESVKSVADVYAPVNGEVVAVNDTLEQAPEQVNESPYEAGWLIRIKTLNPDLSNLMDATAYESFLAEQG